MNIPSAPPPPDYNELVNNDCKQDKLNILINKYEIDYLFSEKLSELENYDVVLIVDDSGSMNTPLDDNTGFSTRWDELKSVVNIVIDISTIFDSDGIDIYFLNRSSYKNINSLNKVNSILIEKPYGATPLTQCVRNVLNDFEHSSKPVLIIIATDGVPTKNGNTDLDDFKQVISSKNHSKFYISFLACSDRESDVGYLNDLDKNIKNVDTLDDYCSEFKEVIAAQGKNFKYSYGDHICRLLLGPLFPELDKLDEKQISKKRCVIL